MRRIIACLIVVGVIALLASFGGSSAEGATATASVSGPTYEATISAYQTQVAKLNTKIDKQSTSIAKRDDKIDAQRTQIADLHNQNATQQAQIPPTSTPTPELTGKDAFPYVGDANEINTRPFNHIGEKMSFCGSVLSIAVAPPGKIFSVGDTKLRSFENLVQITVDGYDVQFMAGYDGDTTGINEDSHVCVWGTLVDTFSGHNGFGGAITNPLFDAEYLELG